MPYILILRLTILLQVFNIITSIQFIPFRRSVFVHCMSQVEALEHAGAMAEENAALRRILADLDAELAALAAESEQLRDENLELSSAIAAQSVDAAELQEMADTLAVITSHLSHCHCSVK